MPLILASSSPYRRRLLQRLGIAFECVSPGIDETPLADESPQDLACRLALAKARAVALAHPQQLVIGSDQVASLQGDIMGKPGTAAGAVEQLKASSGKEIRFDTAVALVRQDPPLEAVHLEPFRVQFRALSDREITAYVAHDKPYDCAGSFKWEGLGIVLFDALRGDDPTSLEGLPLIALSRMLSQAEVKIL